MAFYSESGDYYNALDPAFGKGGKNSMWANYYLGASTGMPPGQAIKDVLGLPNSGIENVELSVLDPAKWEVIPKQMFDEMRRLGQMNVRGFLKAGAPSPISVHSPVVEPTGFNENKWDESQWRQNQGVMNDVVEKAAAFGPNTPVTIHGSHYPSEITRYDKKSADERLILLKDYMNSPYFASQDRERNEKEMKQLQRGEVPEMINAVEPVSGQVASMQEEIRIMPDGTKHWLSPQDRLDNYNLTTWEDNLQKPLLEYQRTIMEALARAKEAGPDSKEGQQWQRIAQSHNSDMNRVAMSTFDRISRGDPDFFKKPEVKAEVSRIGKLPVAEQSSAVTNFLLRVGRPSGEEGAIPYTPQTFQTVEKFGKEKASEALANMAIHSAQVGIEKFHDASKAPIVSIENVYPWAAFGKGEKLKDLIDDTRTKFVNKAKTELKMSESTAKKLSEKIIGATWDISHINMMRKLGYSKEEVLAQIEKVKGDIKHIHVSDNFGMTDAHLAPGMGNVPIKEFMAQLEKEGQLKGVRSIVEAGAYVAEWKDNPTLQTLQYFNAPVYGFQKSPTWGESAGSYFMGASGYSAGYGAFLPPVHFAEYGTGFTALPTALGAPLPGQRSAFSGTPNA
jgi:hypothetical protein